MKRPSKEGEGLYCDLVPGPKVHLVGRGLAIFACENERRHRYGIVNRTGKILRIPRSDVS